MARTHTYPRFRLGQKVLVQLDDYDRERLQTTATVLVATLVAKNTKDHILLAQFGVLTTGHQGGTRKTIRWAKGFSESQVPHGSCWWVCQGQLQRTPKAQAKRDAIDKRTK